MYPATPGSRFDWDYYLLASIVNCRRGCCPHAALLRTEIDKVVGGFPSRYAPTYHAVGHLYFRSVRDGSRAGGDCGRMCGRGQLRVRGVGASERSY